MERNLMIFDEEKIKEVAKSYLLKGRAGDWEHAQRVVKWVKELGKGRDDLGLLITAAYIHDSGWFGIAPKEKIDFNTLKILEEKANANSEPVVREILKKFSATEDDIKKILRCVLAADRHRASKEDEAVVVDADNLSKLCVEHITEKFKPESYTEAFLMFERESVNRISTKQGKAIYPKLLEELKKKLNIKV